MTRRRSGVVQTLVTALLLALCGDLLSSAHAANITVGAGGRMFTTIQAALDSAQAGDMILVDDGTYSECKWKNKEAKKKCMRMLFKSALYWLPTRKKKKKKKKKIKKIRFNRFRFLLLLLLLLLALVTKRNGAAGQEISLVATRHLGVVLSQPMQIAHSFHIVRGFQFASVRSANSARAAVLELAPAAASSVVEWCEFTQCEPRGAESALIRVNGASGATVRANSFRANLFGANTADSLRVLHVEHAARVSVVGNLFADNSIDAARVYDVVFLNVSDSTFKQNAVSVAGFPDVAGVHFADCKRLEITSNFFLAAVEFSDPGADLPDESHAFTANTLSLRDATTRGPAVRFVTGTVSNVTFDNLLVTNCGGTPWICTLAAMCHSATVNGTLTASRIANVVLLEGDQYCLEPVLAANSAITTTNGELIIDEQALAFDSATGCNGLSPLMGAPRGSATNYATRPFQRCFSSVQLFPFPFSASAVATTTTAPPVTAGPPTTTGATTTATVVGETLPPTPPPTPPPTTVDVTQVTTIPNVTFATNNATQAPTVVDAVPLPAAPDSLEVAAIMIIVGPLLVCVVVILIMTLVAFIVRRKKQKALQREGGDRWATAVYT
jgi:hypothetical protein